MKVSVLFLALLILLQVIPSLSNSQEYDVLVYGGTSAGIVAAIQVKKMGKSVLIVEPSNHLGGLTTGGLGATDIGNKHVIGGISRDFYRAVYQEYLKAENWAHQQRSEYLTDESEDLTQWTFEPSVAQGIFKQWVADYKLEIVMNERLDLDHGVTMNNKEITSITTQSGRTFSAKMFIDATYEGDLMALSKVSYTFGREANTVYNEDLNGIQTKYAIYHQFPDGVSPYKVENDPQSGILPMVQAEIENDGIGDQRIQAYCFRMCLTNDESNMIPFEKPVDYDESEYELLFRAIKAGYDGPFFIMSKMPNYKTDSNNKGPFSSDYIGMNYQYPEGNYEEREAIIQQHETYQKGLMWTLANHSRVPINIKSKFKKWGLPKDEFTTNNHWPPQLYIRESRRMIGEFVMTEHHCTQDSISAALSIGMGAYTMDSHHMQRYINVNGDVKNEGDVEVGGFSPYPIGYKAIIPKKEECGNLLVPVCLSSSHIAFGSIRMEPVFMILGQSAATAACLAIDANVSVQNIEYQNLRKRLLKDHQVLEF